MANTIGKTGERIQSLTLRVNFATERYEYFVDGHLFRTAQNARVPVFQPKS